MDIKMSNNRLVEDIGDVAHVDCCLLTNCYLIHHKYENSIF
ncbi:hypothetical protein E24_00137 [Faustovirus]|nr:hypothetical protein E24_00137 [Faustovirus]